MLGFDWGVRSLITASVVEKSPGKKDPEKVRAFIAAVKKADRQPDHGKRHNHKR